MTFLRLLNIVALLAAMALPVVSRAQNSTDIPGPIAHANNGDGKDITSIIEPSPYPGGFFDSFRQNFYTSIYDGADALAVSLFESISNIDIFSQDIGAGNLSVNVQRRIFNNHDISESWTVMDFFRVPYTIPILPSTSIPLGPLSMNLAATGQLSLSTVHIRQVMPKHYSQLKSVSQEQQEFTQQVEQSGQLMTPQAPSKKTVWQKIAGFFKGEFNSPRLRAQYNRLYNLLLQPFKFPFTQKGLLEMPANEIRMYAYEGLLQMSAGVGFNVSAIPGVDLFNMGIGPSVYIGGRWQVGLLKLSNNRLKIKITRMSNNGQVFSFGAQHRWDVFKGFVVFGQNVGHISQTLIPFQMSVARENSHIFDIGHEFDLNKPEALKAAHEMILGQAALAQRLSRQPDSGVQWSFRRDQRSVDWTVAKGIHLDFLLYHQRIAKTQKVDAVLTLPDGEHHYFKGISDSVKAWDTIFGGREVQSYSFQTVTDMDQMEKDPDKAMTLRLSGTIEDARTTGKEMRRYIKQVETTLGDDQLFEEFPTHVRKERCVLKICRVTTRVARYGRTSMLYRASMDRKHLESFINSEEAPIWRALEHAYQVKSGAWETPGKRRAWALLHSPLSALNLPLALVQVHLKSGSKLMSASRFVSKWRDLKPLLNRPKELTFAMATLFRTQYYGAELIHAMLNLLKSRPFNMSLTASNAQLFPSLFKSKEHTQYRDLLIDTIQRDIEFEKPAYWQRINEDNKVSDLKIKKISNFEIEVSFNLSETPNMLFFSLNSKRLYGQKYLDHFVIRSESNGQMAFKKGVNTFRLQRIESNEWKSRLAQYLFEKGTTVLQLSFSTDLEKGWGAVNSTSIYWSGKELEEEKVEKIERDDQRGERD